MTADMVDADRSPDFIRRGCPMGRMGEPHELDGAALPRVGLVDLLHWTNVDYTRRIDR
jgi:hypothetical protein